MLDRTLVHIDLLIEIKVKKIEIIFNNNKSNYPKCGEEECNPRG